QMNCLTMLDHNWLCIRKTLPIDDIIATKFTDEFCVLYVSMNSLLSLSASRTRIYDESAIETSWYLGEVIIMAVIPVSTNVLIVDGEVINICLTWLDWILANSRYPILRTGNLKPVPVYGCCLWEVVYERYAYMVTSSNTNHWTRYGSINR